MLCVQNFANLSQTEGGCKADLATRAHFCGNIIATKSPAGNVQEGVNFAEGEQWSRKNEDIKKYVFAKQIQKNKSINFAKKDSSTKSPTWPAV